MYYNIGERSLDGKFSDKRSENHLVEISVRFGDDTNKLCDKGKDGQ